MHKISKKIVTIVLSMAFVMSMAFAMVPSGVNAATGETVNAQDFTLTYNGNTSYSVTMPSTPPTGYTWEYYVISDDTTLKEKITETFYEMNAMLDQKTQAGGYYTYNGIQKTATWRPREEWQFASATVNIDIGKAIGGFFVGLTKINPESSDFAIEGEYTGGMEPICSAGGTIDIPTTVGQSVGNILGKSFKLNVPSGVSVTPASADGTYTPGTKISITFPQTVNGQAFNPKLTTDPADTLTRDVTSEGNTYIGTMPFSDLTIKDAYKTSVSTQNFSLKNNGDGTYTVTPNGTLGANQSWVVTYVDKSINNVDDATLQELSDELNSSLVGSTVSGSIDYETILSNLPDSETYYFTSDSYTFKAADLKFVCVSKIEKSDNDRKYVITSGSTLKIPDPVKATPTISVTTNTTGNKAPSTAIKNTPKEIEDMIMNASEKANYENGVDTKVYLEVKDISSSIPAEEKAKIEEKLGDNKIAMYFDASLFLKQGNDTRQVTQTNGKIKVAIKIPAEYLNTTTGVSRTFEIVRYHDGVAEIINGTFDASTNEFTFETDKFSTYAIAYQDVVTATTSMSPKTGTPSPVLPMMSIVLVMLSAIGIYEVEKKRI